ncbi:MAG: YifB family Mg chelatase-like AAA ATPase [Ruminococcaceae bacterium]|nr:YifB family Mg chelatase-like AAA ATPase [Oscillospiraceae bacterium]
MFSKVNSVGLSGFKAQMIEVECDLSTGLPRFDLVGLPDSAVSESRERVRSAIKNCGLNFPVSRITVNLAPAEFRKEGPNFDLPILIAILLASKQLKVSLDGCALLGEISLDGELRRINGVLPMVIEAKQHNIKCIFLPFQNATEASLIPDIEIYPVKSLPQLLNHLNGSETIEKVKNFSFENFNEQIYFDKKNEVNNSKEISNIKNEKTTLKSELDFSDVVGQQAAKRALEVAAAGNHNILLIGSPGAGKSMLAKCLPGILPDISFEEAISCTSIYSVAGLLSEDMPLITKRPFRSPHHTSTDVAFAGGGRKATPGEISMAHNGVLFLDEFPMFSRSALETLRQPLEDGKITVSRNLYTATYPGNILLVAAMNPCPCGYLYDPTKLCVCTNVAKQNYISKISGPLLDRIDIQIKVDPLDCELLIKRDTNEEKIKRETSAEIKKRVVKAREIQQKRFKSSKISCNAQMSTRQVHKFCYLTKEAEEILLAAYKRLEFSARANNKILKVARTIADLDDSPNINQIHILEAIQYRSINRLGK